MKDNIKLTVRDCIKDYKSKSETIRVLDGISLDICENEFVIILGESGCGKTTLLNIIGGIDRMDAGSLIYDGEDLSTADKDVLTCYRRKHIGYIFQESNLMPNLSALENVQMIASLSDKSLDPIQCLEDVGLKERCNHFPSELSLGQRQRVAIARAIVKLPDIIIADEPTASLDPKTAKSVLKLLTKVVKEQHISVVMATHDVEFTRLSDRVLTIKEGRI